MPTLEIKNAELSIDDKKILMYDKAGDILVGDVDENS